jgi:secreted trypsin-like serine protease
MQIARLAGGLACLLRLLSACESAPVDPREPRVDVSTQPVIDGERETGFSAVVAIVEAMPGTSGGSLCSGSVIGPYQVLTAKHCVIDEQGQAFPVSALFVAVGDDLTRRTGVSAVLRVSDVHTTPGTDIDAAAADGDDIAILLLSTRTSVAPIAVSTHAPVLGTEVEIVGFGRTVPGMSQASDSGIKYRGTMEVTNLDARLLQTDGSSSACQGDSGGPVLDDKGEIVGIVSFGLDMSCYGSTLISTRVSRHQALIDTALSWTPSCPNPTREVCNGSDDNCDGTVDEGCLEQGEACRSNQQCKGAQCATIDGADVCTSLCDPTQSLASCQPGSYCREFDCGQGVCVLGAVGDGEDGSACTRDTDCAAAHCGSAGRTRLCGRPCHAGLEGGCPLGQVCDDSDGGGESGCAMGICIPVERSDAARPFGSVCESAKQCDSEDCLGAGAADAFCTRACGASAGCGSGFHCRDARCVGGGLGATGASCVDSADCSTMAPDCVARDGDRVCAPSCRDDSGCPGNFACSRAADDSSRCLRKGAALGSDCGADSECSTGLCDQGRCARACSPSIPCPHDFACTPEGHAGAALCVARPPADDGGCSVAAARSTRPSLLMLGLGALYLLRISRRRRSDAGTHRCTDGTDADLD